MKNSVTQEYRDLISKKLFLEREIGNLPIGYIMMGSKITLLNYQVC